MKKSILLSFALVLCLLQQVVAQSKTVSGRVTDQDTGQGLPGVSVSVKGTSTGTNTGADGSYSIAVPSDNTTLVYRFIGMTTQEIVVGARSTVNVTLSTDSRQLAELVVTGYQTQNSREISGSVASVSGEEVALNPIGSFDQALQGRAPGILIQANSGQPGAAANVLIRGRGSLFGGNQPLYILDGVEITAADFATLNPADFESFSVLKDAMSTSIYGSRGANGVIVITTRRGRAGKTQLDYNVQYGFSTMPENKLKLMNSSQKLDYELANGNPYEWDDDDLARLRAVNTNWEDVFFRTGVTKNHTLSASGGSENTTYFLSGSIFDQSGTVQTTGLERYTGRANIENKTGAFTFGLNSTFGYSEFTNTSEANTGIATPLNAIRWTNPYETPYDENGNYTQMTSGQPNALQQLLENTNLRQQLKGVANFYVKYDIKAVPGLSVRTNWGGDYTSNENTNYIDPTTPSGASSTGGRGSLTRSYNRRFRVTGTTSATYATEFGSDHTLSVSLFNEVVTSKYRNLGFTGYGLGGAFENESGITPGTATNGFIPAVAGGGEESALLSYFVTANYGFKERYFVSVTGRRDGSSRFGANNRWANFGSVGASWIVSDEAFMQNLSDIFNELKLKISYGSSGNQGDIAPFQPRELYSRAVYNGVSGLVQNQLSNPDLRWERRTTFNTGFELSTLNGRLRSTLEYYDSRTTDLFLNRQLSRTSGYRSLLYNVGELQNKGVELYLNGDVISTPDFTWSLNANLTYNRNRVTELIGEGDNDVISGNYIQREGESMNSLYMVRYAGVNPDNGNAQYLTAEGEITEVYNAADRVIVGTTEVPFFGGFGTTLRFKGIELSALFSFVQGNKIFNNDRMNVEDPSYLWDNLSAALLNEWRTPGQVTDIPRATQAMRGGTTRFVEDGDFLRLRNLNLSYTLPSSLTNAIHLRRVSVFAQGQNLLTWSKFQGFDPEISTASPTGDDSRYPGTLTGAQYPALRTITFGLNVGL
ncbi:TonB-dependent receptor [Pontibacter sp. SGAir0037]|uniref:SusC/RagA family TonB-linked outer membrane protein n=1 Tax=Pontibacter sp. SGAir0037 TaxID=2571030 RepID=UPI0010CD39AF|nr:TonB-dependent receptor [Pontibacter sp. SGAir0037]QCR21059.1 TonB-dependent receptor [Pontibacter sp. SGAir0037]